MTTDEENVVNTGHTWVAFVGGAKYVYSLYDINKNGLRDDQVLLGDQRRPQRTLRAWSKTWPAERTTGKSPVKTIKPGQVIYIGDWGKQTGAWYTRFADARADRCRVLARRQTKTT